MEFKEMIKKFVEEHKEYYENNFPLKLLLGKVAKEYEKNR